MSATDDVLLDNQTDDDENENDDIDVTDNPVAKKLRNQNKQLRRELKSKQQEFSAAITARDRAQEIRDMDLGLNNTQIELLQQAHKDKEFNRDEIIKTATELKWVDPAALDDANNNDELTRTTSDARSVTSSATSSSSSNIITADSISTWSTEKMRDFMDKHPIEWEDLKRGGEVQVSGY